MIIKWLEKAIDDLRALRQYISQDNPQAANRTAKKIVEHVNLLSHQPSIGRPGRVFGTRELIIADTPYIAPYRVKNNNIEILRIFHTAREWPDNF